MRFMSQEKQKKYPNLAFLSRQCQRYSMAEYGSCQGCDLMIDGCEKVVRAQVDEREMREKLPKGR